MSTNECVLSYGEHLPGADLRVICAALCSLDSHEQTQANPDAYLDAGTLAAERKKPEDVEKLQRTIACRLFRLE